MREPAHKGDQDENFHAEVTVEQGEFQEWWETDRLDAVGWGLAFIWGALVLLADRSGFSSNIAWWDGWGVFFTGAGVITLTIAAIRFLATGRGDKAVGGLLFGLILLGIGLGGTIAVWFWPLVLIIIGTLIIRSAFTRGK